MPVSAQGMKAARGFLVLTAFGVFVSVIVAFAVVGTILDTPGVFVARVEAARIFIFAEASVKCLDDLRLVYVDFSNSFFP